MLTIASFLMGAAWGFGIALLLVVLAVRVRRREDNAARLEYLKECGFDPEECKESHLSGDCPLCGAE